MRLRVFLLVAVAGMVAGCASMRVAMRIEATRIASRDLACGVPKVDALEDWSSRAESACPRTPDAMTRACGGVETLAGPIAIDDADGSSEPRSPISSEAA